MSTQTPSDPSRDAKAELKAAKAYAKAQRPWYTKKRYIALGLFALLVVISVAAGGGGDSNNNTDSADNSSPPPPPAANSAPAPANSCTTNATDDCTPDVASNRAVRVDALTWSVESSRTASTLGDQQFGAGAKADGTFVVVTLKVRSNKDESATITDEAVKLEAPDGTTYSSDSEGTIAAIGSGEDPLFFEDLGPTRPRRARSSSTFRRARSVEPD
ncbi:MAG TPA: DUF4352 domain-containing protein [Solirubrobacteraceae bacterium]|nr:DUF4352 domain-containing protein [Solirubrobacteraceae bacterium]